MKYIGIDYGTKRVGIATSDDGGSMAFPKIVVPTAQAALMVEMLVKGEGAGRVGGIVMGESRDREGRDNAVMAAARAFAEQTRVATGAEIFWEWEGYTTSQARATRADVTHKNGDGRARGNVARKVSVEREVVDASAAAIILQSFLDKQNAGK
jgi:putative holliday junction resolvase